MAPGTSEASPRVETLGGIPLGPEHPIGARHLGTSWHLGTSTRLGTSSHQSPHWDLDTHGTEHPTGLGGITPENQAPLGCSSVAPMSALAC